jgi:oxysterol-binding protein-related protein 9/10/11
VTDNLLIKNFGEATKMKQKIEQDQRDITAERKKRGEESVITLFPYQPQL